MKNLFSTCLLFILLIGLNTQAYNYIWLEAETGAEFDPLVVKSAENASQNIFIAQWTWRESTNRSSETGIILFDVEAPVAGNYYFWARLEVPWNNVHAYDIALSNADLDDNSQWKSWKVKDVDDSDIKKWSWQKVDFDFELSKGKNTIKLVQMKGGVNLKLDKILMTDDSLYTPEGLGESERASGSPSTYKANTVKNNGQLQVIGTQLSNENGDPIQLQGISTHGLQWFPLIDNQTIPRTAKFFGNELIRLAMYIEDYNPQDVSDYWGGFQSDPEKMKARARMAIEDAIDAGIYVIVDWHIHNDPSIFTDEAREFFDEISKDYGQYPNIIYEIANEPLPDVSWESDIYPYATEIITTIRNNDPDGVVIIGTPFYSQRIDIAANYPLAFDNIMYAFHYYAGSHDFNTMTQRIESALSAGAPVFISEWGSSNYSVNNSNFEVAKNWVNFMNKHELSWANWSLGNKDESSSILKATAPMSGPWTDDDLTTAGLWIKDHFDEPDGNETKPTVTPTPIVSPTSTPTPTPTPTPKPASELQCSVSENVWNNGYVATIEITNVSEETIYTWSVDLTIGANDTITGSWSAQLTQSGEIVTASNSNNGVLSPGQSATFGFQANYDGEHTPITCQD